jgi:hypothetical protein
MITGSHVCYRSCQQVVCLVKGNGSTAPPVYILLAHVHDWHWVFLHLCSILCMGTCLAF